ncbi:MAG TPA: sulfotransferase [Rhodanobacteraceae bacterium]
MPDQPATRHTAAPYELTPGAARLLARARREWDARQFEAAERTLDTALALAPGHPGLTRMQGMVAQHRGHAARAAACFRSVLSVWPDDADLLMGLGLALFETGEVEEGTTHLRRACALAPQSAAAWFNFGQALWRRAAAADAIDPLQRALAIAPDHIGARLSLARARAGLGDVAAGIAEFREVLRRDPLNADAWYGLSLNAPHFDATDVAPLAAAFARGDLPSRTHALLGFAYAKALEDQCEYARAFTVYRAANAAQRTRLRWDAAQARALVEQIRAAFTADLPAPADPALGESAIFIMSMPRSGSTLVEQILASHPAVEGANEIKDLREVVSAETDRRHAAFPAWVPAATPADWQRLGAEYLARTARWRKTKPRFTDKNLLNWYLAGAALTMLPAARIVVVRRDPVETCLACYRHCFTEEAGFTCSLNDTADYCADFMALTRFWLRRYPQRVFDLEYERLVAEPEATIRRLLDFCGLPFDAACLDFHRTARAVLTPSAAQVRQPLRHDTARSARYGAALDPLRQRLRAAGVIA